MWIYAYRKNSREENTPQRKASRNDNRLQQINLNMPQGHVSKGPLKKSRKYYFGKRVHTEATQPISYSINQDKSNQNKSYRSINNNQSIPMTENMPFHETAHIRNTHINLFDRSREPQSNPHEKSQNKSEFLDIWNRIKHQYERSQKSMVRKMNNDRNSHNVNSSSGKKVFTTQKKTLIKKNRFYERKKTETSQVRPQDIFANNVIKNLNTLLVFTDGDQKIPKKKSKVHEKNPAYKITSEKQLEIIKLVGQGTFGKVFHAFIRSNKKQIALKKIVQDRSYKSRQIQLLRQIKNPYIIQYITDFPSFERNEKEQSVSVVNIITEYYPSNFYSHIKAIRNRLEPLQLKLYLYQMFRGLLALHCRGVCHRDIKPQNMLIKNGRLVICDLGSAKILRKGQKNVSYICSRCYRAPELIFGAAFYELSIDIWSAGCVILQIINKTPLFIGKNSLEHLVEVIKILGTPTHDDIKAMNSEYNVQQFDVPLVKKKQWSEILPSSIDPALISLISKIMIYNPSKRLTASQVLIHPYFDEIRDFSTYASISKKIDIYGFFKFDQREKQFASTEISKLIPQWFSNSGQYF